MVDNILFSAGFKLFFTCLDRFVKPKEIIVDIGAPVETYVANNLKNKGYKFRFMAIHKLHSSNQKRAVGRRWLILSEVYYDKKKELVLIYG